MALRLSPESAGRLPESVRRPGFERAGLKPGILHLGVGAFHRCHQAEFTDDALEARGGDWGIRGVNLAPPDLGPGLGEQGGLYCRELRHAGACERRLIAALRIPAICWSDPLGLA
jgi:fructuronate reductase